MEGILNIFQSITNLNDSDLSIFLKSIENHQSFRYETNTAVVQSITSLLNQAHTRHTGLVILSAFLKQASHEVIEQKGILWTTLCLKGCNSKEQSSTVSIAYDVINKLLQKSIDIPDLMKAFSSHLLGKLFDTLSSIPVSSHLSVLKIIENCLKLYSGPSSQFRALIEKFLFTLVDSKDEIIVNLSGKCMHLLQQIRGSGAQGISFKIAWQNYHLKLLGNLHELIEKIYANCSEVYDEGVELEKLQLSPLQLSNEPVSRALQLYTRFKNLLTYLELALKEPFPVSKCIMVKKNLNLISRVLSINCEILKKNPISDNLAVGIFLPEMHLRCFKLIRTMILILGSNLTMYYKTILNFVMETLKWTSFGKAIGFCKPYNSLRIAVYQTLSLWCETMKNASECQVIEEILVEQILYDIIPFQNEVTLKVLSGTKKHMSKKARRLLHKAQNEQTHLIQAHSRSVNPQNTKKELSDEGNENLCAAALNCLKSVLSASGHSIKPVLIKEIQLRIFELCIQLKQEQENVNTLYSNQNCRKNLYAVVFSFVSVSHHLCPPPIQLIITIINHAHIYDESKLVREDCNFYIKNLETIIHPSKDNLNFPHDLNEIKKIIKELEKRYNSKNTEEDDEENEQEIQVEFCSIENDSNNKASEVNNKFENDNDIIDIDSESEIEFVQKSSNSKITSSFVVNSIERKEVLENNKIVSCTKSISNVKIDNSSINISDDEQNSIEPVVKKIRLEEIKTKSTNVGSSSVNLDVKQSKVDERSKRNGNDDEHLVEEIIGTFINELKKN